MNHYSSLWLHWAYGEQCTSTFFIYNSFLLLDCTPICSWIGRWKHDKIDSFYQIQRNFTFVNKNYMYAFYFAIIFLIKEWCIHIYTKIFLKCYIKCAKMRKTGYVNEKEILIYCFQYGWCDKEKDLNSLDSKLPEKPTPIHNGRCHWKG